MIANIKVEVLLGIHAGIAALLLNVGKRYNNHAFIKSKDKRANLNDACRVLALGVCQGDEVCIIVDGEQEEEHMNELIHILQVE